MDLAVNVAQVPQRSPFRYPGGKTWLIPVLRQWLQHLPPSGRRTFLEPFAGGATATLLAIMEHYSMQAAFCEVDREVASVWSCAVSEQGLELAAQVETFQLNRKRVGQLFKKAQECPAPANQALAVIVRNRIQRGGVMAPGAGRIKSGENEHGLASRWYPATLAQRLRAIHAVRDQLQFTAGDGFRLLQHFQRRTGAAAFVDPPYYGEGKRLYAHGDIDHRQVFTALRDFSGDFLLTYDDAPQIRAWVAEFGLAAVAVNVKTTHHTVKRELLISRQLGWLVASA